MPKQEKCYFAAANTAGGFVSWFDEIFEPETIERTYILKGGSGTGKSTFMKRLAEAGKQRGFTPEYYYCSADPTSLDGLILSKNGEKIYAVVDGTSPHIRDPHYPGAREEILNLGAFWSIEPLVREREKIAKLAKEKAKAYNEAYASFSAAGEIEKVLSDEIRAHLQTEKMQAAIDRLLVALAKEKKISLTEKQKTQKSAHRRGLLFTRPVSALTTAGRAWFPTYEENADSLISVNDTLGSSRLYLEKITEAAVTRGLLTVVAPDPLLPAFKEAVYFPELGVSFIKDEPKTDRFPTRFVNMERFLDDRITRADRSRRRNLEKSEKRLVESGLSRLSDIRGLHAELEAIYRSAMDFPALDAFGENFASELFSETK